MKVPNGNYLRRLRGHEFEEVVDWNEIINTTMTQHCMVDIETLGTEPGAVILSIGAVKFDEDELGETFYGEITKQSCEDHGLVIEADTLDWWLSQDDDAQEVLTEGGHKLEDVLRGFTTFYEGCETIWANAPTFDCRHLKVAYEAIGWDIPWSFRDERCFRTLKALPGAITEPGDWDGTAHDALDDARWQARVTQLNLREMN